jgi:hypothetical protein
VGAQARDARFCNASVEFDLATLAPTYRLIWRSAGASNALAIAAGLGFDPLVIAEARKVGWWSVLCREQGDFLGFWVFFRSRQGAWCCWAGFMCHAGSRRQCCTTKAQTGVML